MDSDTGALASIFYFLLFTFLHAAFALSETALLRTQTFVLGRPEFVGRFGNRLAMKLIKEPAVSLLVLQVGALGSLAAAIIVLHRLCFGLDVTAVTASVSPTVVFVLGVLTTILAGSFIPRMVALRSPEQTLMVVSPPIYLLTRIFNPIALPVLLPIKGLLKILNISAPTSLEFVHSAVDITRFLDNNSQDGAIDEDEKEMIQGVFEFAHTVAREVMTPRTDLVTIPIHASLDEIVGIIVSSGHSRFPVRGESIDDIRGILLAKDVLPILANEKKRAEFALSRVMRKAFYIPDTKPIDDLLNELKRRKIHMAIVLDEHGGVDGLVTLEDLIEEIVGDIFDESDVPEEDYEVEPGGDILVDGGMLVFELNEHFGLGIPEGDYDTIAGFIFTSLGRMPHIGDCIEIEPPGVLLIPPSPGASNGRPSSITELLDEDDGESKQKVSIIVEEIVNNRISLVRIKSAEMSESTESLRNRAAS